MPLQKGTIGAFFTEGVDVSVDAKVTNSMRDLENVAFEKTGRISKRPGYDKLTGNMLDGSAWPGDVNGLHAHGDSLLCAAGRRLLAYSEDGWADTGDLDPIQVRVSQVPLPPNITDLNNIFQYTDVAYCAGFLCLLAGGTVFVIEQATGAIVQQTDLNGLASGTFGRLAVANNRYFFVAFDDAGGSTISVRHIDTQNPTAISSSSTVTATKRSLTFFALEGIPGTSTAALICDDGSGILGARLTTAGMAGGHRLSLATMTTRSMPAITFDSAGTNAFFAYSTGSDVVQVVTNNVIGSTVAAAANVATSLGTVVSIVGKPDASTANQVVWHYGHQQSVSSPTMNYYSVSTNTGNSAGSVGTASVFLRNATLASGWFANDGTDYICVKRLYPSDTNRPGNHYIYTEDQTLVGQFLTDSSEYDATATGLKNFFVSHVAANGLGLFWTTASEFTRAYERLPRLVEIDTTAVLRSAYAVGATYITGSLPRMYDGTAPVEATFLEAPEIAAEALTSGGGLADGTYVIVGVFEWYDDNGRLHRSAPSYPKTLTISGGGGNGTFRYRVAYLDHTKRNNVVLRIYRTENAGTLFYRTGAGNIQIGPAVSSSAVTNASTNALSILSGNVPLYTDSGELENVPLPPVVSFAFVGERLFAATADGLVYYSKATLPNTGLAFSAELYRDAGQNGGDVTAITGLDDNIVILRKNAIQVFGGSGPTAAGVGARWTAIRNIATDVGAANGATATFPGGVFFQSTRGLLLLDRTLQVQPAGDPVEDIQDLSVVSSVVVPARTEIRFGTSDGRAAVLNYGNGKWHWDTGKHSGPATVWRDKYAYPTETGQVFVQNESTFRDGGANYTMSATLPWVKPNNLIAGFQRIYWVALVGEFVDIHKLVIELLYDFKDDVVETIEVTSADLLAEDSAYRVRFKPARQKCQAFSMRIRDDGQGGEGGSFSLSGMVLEVGLLPGVSRLRASQTV